MRAIGQRSATGPVLSDSDRKPLTDRPVGGIAERPVAAKRQGVVIGQGQVQRDGRGVGEGDGGNNRTTIYGETVRAALSNSPPSSMATPR